MEARRGPPRERRAHSGVSLRPRPGTREGEAASEGRRASASAASRGSPRVLRASPQGRGAGAVVCGTRPSFRAIALNIYIALGLGPVFAARSQIAKGFGAVPAAPRGATNGRRPPKAPAQAGSGPDRWGAAHRRSSLTGLHKSRSRALDVTAAGTSSQPRCRGRSRRSGARGPLAPRAAASGEKGAQGQARRDPSSPPAPFRSALTPRGPSAPPRRRRRRARTACAPWRSRPARLSRPRRPRGRHRWGLQTPRGARPPRLRAPGAAAAWWDG